MADLVRMAFVRGLDDRTAASAERTLLDQVQFHGFPDIRSPF
jgi:hypothetical protein